MPSAFDRFSGTRAVDLTFGELQALWSATVETIDSADDQQRLNTFGTHAGVAAGLRAQAKLIQALRR